MSWQDALKGRAVSAVYEQRGFGRAAPVRLTTARPEPLNAKFGAQPGGYWLPYPPSANRYWRHVGRKVILSKEARLYRERIKAILRDAECQTGWVRVELEVVRPRKAGDLDNQFKQLFDAAKGLLWEDDSQVVEIHAWRMDDKARPGVLLRVRGV